MKIDEIEIGKTYRMRPGGLVDRLVLDILWHPAGFEGYTREYREVICEFASGKRQGGTESVSLEWFAANATEAR